MTITRQHRDLLRNSWAVYSDCMAYRYSLIRVWDASLPKACFVMLNPSTATEVHNDPTVERCERRARAMGFGAFQVANIFAYRATEPKDMRRASDPVGPENDRAILDAAAWADQTICAWGTHGAYLGRGAQVAGLLRHQCNKLFHLGLTKDGAPKHPLYIGYDVAPMEWVF